MLPGAVQRCLTLLHVQELLVCSGSTFLSCWPCTMHITVQHAVLSGCC